MTPEILFRTETGRSAPSTIDQRHAITSFSKVQFGPSEAARAAPAAGPGKSSARHVQVENAPASAARIEPAIRNRRSNR